MYRFDITWVAIVAGMLFSIFAGIAVHQAQLESARDSFEAEVFQHATAIGREFDLNAESLYVLKGLFEGSESVTSEEFRRTANESIGRHNDLMALGWVPKTAGDSRADIVAQRRQEWSEFDLIEMANGNARIAADRDIYYPIYFVEPITGNGQLMGLDLGAKPEILKVINQAADGGILTTSSALGFLSPNYPIGSVLIALPIYRGMPVTIETRRSQLLGVVIAIMSVNFMVQEGLGVHSHDKIQSIMIVDESGLEPTVLYQQGKEPSNDTIRRRIDQVSSSRWFLLANPIDGLVSGLQKLVSGSISLAGILLFLTLAFLHSASLDRNKIITDTVRERTRKLNEANEKLAILSSTDQLTGVSNRRELDRYLQEEWQRMAREKQPLSLMMIDVDVFKSFNDNYGHPAGDACLVTIVKALEGQLKRTTDRLARYGGEEFVIILSNTGEEAATLAEDCRRAVENENVTHAFSNVSDRVTISIGLATMIPDQSLSPEKLIAAADRALYKAKEQGRNRVVIADQE